MVLYSSCKSIDSKHDASRFYLTASIYSWGIPFAMRYSYCDCSDYEAAMDIPGMESNTIQILCFQFQWLWFWWRE